MGDEVVLTSALPGPLALTIHVGRGIAHAGDYNSFGSAPSHFLLGGGGATHPRDGTADVVRLLYIVAELRIRNEDICASFQLSHSLCLKKTFD